MQFDRFRAYAKATATRSVADKDNPPAKIVVDSWDVEDVAFEGEADADGKATFDAGETLVSRVVFYSGAKDAEAVCGEVAVNAGGIISLACPAA